MCIHSSPSQVLSEPIKQPKFLPSPTRIGHGRDRAQRKAESLSQDRNGRTLRPRVTGNVVFVSIGDGTNEKNATI